jgi:hypothetical protein
MGAWRTSLCSIMYAGRFGGTGPTEGCFCGLNGSDDFLSTLSTCSLSSCRMSPAPVLNDSLQSSKETTRRFQWKYIIQKLVDNHLRMDRECDFAHGLQGDALVLAFPNTYENTSATDSDMETTHFISSASGELQQNGLPKFLHLRATPRAS